jgi:hypothetical protein
LLTGSPTGCPLRVYALLLGSYFVAKPTPPNTTSI